VCVSLSIDYGTMNRFLSLLLACALFLTSSSSAFTVRPGLGGGSSFVVSTKASSAASLPRTHASGSQLSQLHMGSQAKFGVFSPAVYAAKIVLGDDKLNKIRGKAISLHSQYIGDFCLWVGGYHLRTRLIKKAKQNGDILGFLV